MMKNGSKASKLRYFETSLQHLLAELERIDLLIAAQVARARRLFAHDEQFRGLYISEDEVDALLKQPIGRPRWAGGESALSNLTAKLDKISQRINLRKQESVRRNVELRLHNLQQLFGLDQFEVDAVLVCLAVELDLRYERLYAYLQDDVTKKRPSVDLVLNLLAPSAEAKFAACRRFAADAPLLSGPLLELVADPSQAHPPLLAKYLKVDSRIARYLLGSDEQDERIQSFAIMHGPQDHLSALQVDDNVKRRLGHFIGSGTTTNGAIVYLRGPYGVGRQSTAAAVCRDLGIRLLIADLDWLTCEESGACEKAFGFVQREAKLQQAAVYWKSFDTVLDEKKKRFLRGLIRSLEDRPALTFLAGETLWQPVEALRAAPYSQVELPRPTFSQRRRMWSEVFDDSSPVDGFIQSRFSRSTSLKYYVSRLFHTNVGKIRTLGYIGRSCPFEGVGRWLEFYESLRFILRDS